MEEIKSRKNPLVRHLKKLGTDGDYRKLSGEFICDGDKLLCEAVESRAVITAVLTCGPRPDKLPGDVPLYQVERSIIETVSPLKNPQDIVFSCLMPKLPEQKLATGLYVILEGIQDPGNIGTILRTAAAFGIAQVILTGGCADPYGPKAVRASMGAVFRQPVGDDEFRPNRPVGKTRVSRYTPQLSAKNAGMFGRLTFKAPLPLPSAAKAGG